MARLALILMVLVAPGLTWADLTVQVNGSFWRLDPDVGYVEDGGLYRGETGFVERWLGGTMASARASYGSVSLGSAFEPFTLFHGESFAEFRDYITVNTLGAGPGWLDLSWHYDNAEWACASLFDVNGYRPAPTGWSCPAGEYLQTLPFDAGVPLTLWASLRGWINLDISMHRSPNSYIVLENILVRDLEGNIILVRDFQAASGARYPLDPRNITPEPGTLALVALASALLLGRLRRRARASSPAASPPVRRT